ncbi:MAG: glycosyltransferase family 4 protein [Lachnospiraceae bacterium]|nr:glycosyltransferase family 4 protein [Lachnospiraceae bacterium]
MKKICYVVTISATIKAFFVKQLQYLSENGFDVTVVCSPDTTLQEILGKKVRYIPIKIPRGISIGGSFSTVKRLYNFFTYEKFDLIQYSTPNAAFYASIAAKMVGCNIRNYHLMGFRYLGASGIGHSILKLIEKTTCRNSTSIECVSKSNLEIGVREKIFPREKTTVVWNGSTGGVDMGRFDAGKRSKYRNEIRSRYELCDNDFVFGFVGRITRDKGVNEILEAFAKIRNAKLMMIGNPEGTETLKPDLYSWSLEHSNIIYTGNVDDVEKYYAALDTLLLPSYREGFGNVVIEAGAIGTPAIVSKIPGPIDTIAENKTALVVSARSAQDLECAMKMIQTLDYKQMGINAVKFATSHFDSILLIEKILDRKRTLLGIE